ncbi:MAG: hypothetical protein ACI915_003475 [Gammaproteobacteria bacterium]|jgi:uncharacterized protein (DUF2235 family)
MSLSASSGDGPEQTGARGMATKNIVICCDGTGNEVSANISNV